MDEESVKQLRTSYEELKFMISGTPQPGPGTFPIRATTVEHFQQILENMNALTESEGISFDRFRFFPAHEKVYNVPIADFRIKLMAAIGFMNQKFFPEDKPFSGSPGTIINMSQTAVQQVHQELIVNLTEQTALKSQEFDKGSPEREFLDQFKDSLKTIKSATDLVESILNIGQKLGLAIPAILKILPWT
jgi:hypothetical protein